MFRNMRFRKYMSILALAGTLFTCASCSFLKEDPATSISETSAYRSEEALESQIYGILSSFYGRYMMQGYMNEQLHTASGLMMWKGQRTQDDWTEALKFAIYSNTTPNQGWYQNLYASISCCNRLLDNLPSSPVGEQFKTEIEAEARFYRAVLYYYLVRLYADVPLILTCPKNIEETNQPRTVYYKVYAAIFDDLNFAEKHMRDKVAAEAKSPGRGRPCNWAATAMKASVYMTIGSMLSSYEADSSDQFFDTSKDAALVAEGKDPRTPDFKAIGINTAKDAWTLCYQTAEKVIHDGPYRLAHDYRQLFRWTEPEDFTLDERIFVLQSTNTSAPENRLALMSLPMFVEGSSNTTTKNGNFGRFRPSRFLFQKFAQDNGGTKGREGADNEGIYVKCPDPRFNASFIHTSYRRLDTGTSLKVYPDASCVRVIDGASVFPYYRKYLDPTFDVNSGCADFYLMRFAEMYLISAEAAARLSAGVGDAYWHTALDRIETLHSRARKSTDGQEAEFPTWKDRTFSDKDELVNAIIWERAYEMCAEGHEYFDTHRCGAKWLSEQIALPLNEFLLRSEQGPGEGNVGVFKYNYVGSTFPTSRADLRKSLLCAFPATTEGIYNTKIDPVKDQNDFYWQ